MIVIPAIDLIDGRCVRLTEGAFDTVQAYSDNPATVAREMANAGAQRLHVVDLDAARGLENNLSAIRGIRQAFPGVIEVGGGIRTLKDAQRVLDIGVDYLIVGTAVAKTPKLVANWARALGPVLIAGIDARDGVVKTSGWKSESSLRAVELAAEVKQLGVIEIIHTDISRDGTLKGPNTAEAVAIAQVSGLPVIISGGIGSMEHLETLAASAPIGICGVIFGKALYEGRVNLEKAIRLLEGGPGNTR